MGFNAAGVLAVADVILRPRLLLPKLTIKDIRQLNLQKLKKKGIKGIVVDKDNCLTKPRKDGVVDELKEAWPQLVNAFGRKNVLIVSNSAGTRDDAGLLQVRTSANFQPVVIVTDCLHLVGRHNLQAESVSRQLGVPVLVHAVKKPGCSQSIVEYFQHRHAVVRLQEDEGKSIEPGFPPVPIVDIQPSKPASSKYSPSFDTITASTLNAGIKILVIGDRVMTDIVLANRLNGRKANRRQGQQEVHAIPILTTTVWEMEGPGSRMMRALETFVMTRVQNYYKKRHTPDELNAWKDCLVVPEETQKITPTPMNSDVAKPSTARAYMVPIQLLSHLTLRLTSPVRTYFALRINKYRTYVDQLLLEARQNYYGFRLPDGLSKFDRFRKVVEDGITPNTFDSLRRRIKRG